MRALLLTLTTCLLVLPAQAKYSGGSGTAQDPYQIATAADLILLGESPKDYASHFVLTADIDLDPRLPGRKVFDKAVIAPDINAVEFFQGTPFTGVFDGNGHMILNLTITGVGWLGLFGYLESGAVRSLGVVDVNATGSGYCVGGLVGYSWGTVTQCYSAGAVSGPKWSVGGLVGSNSGTVTQCYSTAAISGDSGVGGLVGGNGGIVTNCYTTGAVSGKGAVGGLVGYNSLDLAGCTDCWNGAISNCYSVGVVTGTGGGGLVGDGEGTVTNCFWDTQSSGQGTSAGGTGRTTDQMKTVRTFLCWGTCGNEGVWTIDEGKDYPRLWWENQPGETIRLAKLSDLLLGTGTENDPFLIYTPEGLNTVGLFPCEWDKHFKLMADIDMSGFDGKDGRPAFNIIAPDANPSDQYSAFQGTPFTGVFDGNSHAISHLRIKREGYVGLLGLLGSGGEVKTLEVVDVNIIGSAAVGGLVGSNYAGAVTQCYSTGEVSGIENVGGLVGDNMGAVTQCYSTAAVIGDRSVGGLVGSNSLYYFRGDWCGGAIKQCYSTGVITGNSLAGGLVGSNNYYGTVTQSFQSFWDTQTSGKATSEGGTGKTTAEMRTAATFLEAGWDFVGETKNGTADIWWILEGKDYPRLWWEAQN